MFEDGRTCCSIQRGRPPGEGLWAVPGGKVQLRGDDDCGRAERGLGGNRTAGQPRAGHMGRRQHWTGRPPGLAFLPGRLSCAVEGGDLLAGDDAAAIAWVPLGVAREYPLTPTMFDLLDVLELK